MVSLKVEMTPFRMTLNKTKSVELMVQVENDGAKERLISLEIILDNQLAFDKQGRTNAIARKIGLMQPKERFVEYFNVFPKMNIVDGEHKIFVTTMEHFENNYEYILSKKTKQIDLIVD
ncbi:MAG: hypothetical protein PHQ98_04055 [Candidatus ainarchaeum sp.]|nr:hypothetical protein [Candidatus ainarchaeum sp.]